MTTTADEAITSVDDGTPALLATLSELRSDPVVSLVLMSVEEFGPWQDAVVADYAADLALADNRPAAELLIVAQREAAELLPDGLATKGHHLFRVVQEGSAVGWLWLGPRGGGRSGLWIYDISIEADRRGEGLGRATMVAAERLARAEGHEQLGLNVFGHNPGAEALYRSLGYQTVTTVLSKDL